MRIKLLILTGAIAWAGAVSATTGGPTYISQIGIKQGENAVYYIENDYGGRGCPPIVNKLDLTTGENSQVKSCDQVEREYGYEEGAYDKYTQFVSDFFKDISYSGSVSLKRNNIDVDVEVISENSSDYGDGKELNWTDFKATITQSDKELRTIYFRGCSKDQPHIFEGYMVPDSDKMALLVSNKGDCFEGGYVMETLHLVSGVKYLDTDAVRSFKTESATEPNVGNLVVYAEESAEAVVTNEGDSSPSMWLVGLGVGLLVGGGIGYLMRKNRTVPPAMPV